MPPFFPEDPLAPPPPLGGGVENVCLGAATAAGEPGARELSFLPLLCLLFVRFSFGWGFCEGSTEPPPGVNTAAFAASGIATALEAVRGRSP